MDKQIVPGSGLLLSATATVFGWLAYTKLAKVSTDNCAGDQHCEKLNVAKTLSLVSAILSSLAVLPNAYNLMGAVGLQTQMTDSMVKAVSSFTALFVLGAVVCAWIAFAFVSEVEEATALQPAKDGKLFLLIQAVVLSVLVVPVGWSAVDALQKAGRGGVNYRFFRYGSKCY